MRRYGRVLAVLLVAALIVPSVALAVEPIPLTPPAEGVLVVPAGAPLVIPAGWVAGNRGLAMKGPQHTRFFFMIVRNEAAGPVVALQMTTAQSRGYWLPGVVRATSEDVGFELTPFNPRIGAKPYMKQWAYPIPDGLPAGDYTFVSGGVQTRTAIDLLWWFDGQRSVYRIPAGPLEFPDWNFTVE